METFSSCDIKGTVSQIVAAIRLNISGDLTDIETDNQGQTRYRRIKTPVLFCDRDLVWREVAKNSTKEIGAVIYANSGIFTPTIPVSVGVVRYKISPCGYLIVPLVGGGGCKVVRLQSIDFKLNAFISPAWVGKKLSMGGAQLAWEHKDFFEKNNIYSAAATMEDRALARESASSEERAAHSGAVAITAASSVLSSRFVAEACSEIATHIIAAGKRAADGNLEETGVGSLQRLDGFLSIILAFELLADRTWIKWLHEKQQIPILQYKPEIDKIGFLLFGICSATSLLYYDIGVELVRLFKRDDAIDLLGSVANATVIGNATVVGGLV